MFHFMRLTLDYNVFLLVTVLACVGVAAVTEIVVISDVTCGPVETGIGSTGINVKLKRY